MLFVAVLRERALTGRCTQGAGDSYVHARDFPGQTSSDRLASCHASIVRKLQRVINNTIAQYVVLSNP